MGSHCHDWIEYNGVAFSKELLEWGHKFSDFGGRKEFKMGRFSVTKNQRELALQLALTALYSVLENTLIS